MSLIALPFPIALRAAYPFPDHPPCDERRDCLLGDGTGQLAANPLVNRSKHHARGVDSVIFPLLGLVLLHMDDDSDISVRGSEGSEGNILWFQVRGKRFTFRYEHSNGSIELREEKHTGSLVTKFTNQTTIDDMRKVFERL